VAYMQLKDKFCSKIIYELTNKEFLKSLAKNTTVKINEERKRMYTSAV